MTLHTNTPFKVSIALMKAYITLCTHTFCIRAQKENKYWLKRLLPLAYNRAFKQLEDLHCKCLSLQCRLWHHGCGEQAWPLREKLTCGGISQQTLPQRNRCRSSKTQNLLQEQSRGIAQQTRDLREDKIRHTPLQSQKLSLCVLIEEIMAKKNTTHMWAWTTTQVIRIVFLDNYRTLFDLEIKFRN